MARFDGANWTEERDISVFAETCPLTPDGGEGGRVAIVMKNKLKPTKLSSRRTAATISSQPIVPLRERRLKFDGKWDYAPAPEDSKSYVIAPQHELFIGGKLVKPHSGKYFPSVNPATEEKLTEIAAGDEADVDKAVKAA